MDNENDSAIREIMNLIDEHKDNYTEAMYINMCNIAKRIYDLNEYAKEKIIHVQLVTIHEQRIRNDNKNIMIISICCTCIYHYFTPLHFQNMYIELLMIYGLTIVIWLITIFVYYMYSDIFLQICRFITI